MDTESTFEFWWVGCRLPRWKTSTADLRFTSVQFRGRVPSTFSLWPWNDDSPFHHGKKLVAKGGSLLLSTVETGCLLSFRSLCICLYGCILQWAIGVGIFIGSFSRLIDISISFFKRTCHKPMFLFISSKYK